MAVAERIDWSKVAIDTLVKVRYTDLQPWELRHFSRVGSFSEGIYAFANGCSSYTAVHGIGGEVYYRHAEIVMKGDPILCK